MTSVTRQPNEYNHWTTTPPPRLESWGRGRAGATALAPHFIARLSIHLRAERIWRLPVNRLYPSTCRRRRSNGASGGSRRYRPSASSLLAPGLAAATVASMLLAGPSLGPNGRALNAGNVGAAAGPGWGPVPGSNVASSSSSSRAPVPRAVPGGAYLPPTTNGVMKYASAPRARRGVYVSGTRRYVVLRIWFDDLPSPPRYTKTQVQTFFQDISDLWKTTSSGAVTINTQVSDLYHLHGNSSSSTYWDSNGWFAYQTLIDAIEASGGQGIDWSKPVDGIFVVVANKWSRGVNFGTSCNLQLGPKPSSTKSLPCSIVSENPSDADVNVWGRWAHETGHMLQAGGPAHPSNYNSNFEQMDALYPGQSGAFEKQTGQAFGWMPDTKYIDVTPSMGGVNRNIYTEEQAPSSSPNAQAIRAYINGPGSAYYLISVRRPIRGDELSPIPDEGVLIERVTPNGDPWVTIEGRGGNRDDLWHNDQTYTNASDGIAITVSRILDRDNYEISVSYGSQANRPDVGLESWLQPPGSTYETTDIWVDSPVNGYGVYRYGTWSDLHGGMVPRGNGDDPAIGEVNRLYARVRNYGSVAATNVVVRFDVTNPLGVGINGSNGFTSIGSVSSAQFPALASIPPGGYTDVYIDWTPKATLTAQQKAQGIFYFHSCVRVRIDHLPTETIFGNQDGNGQQENIDYFQVPPAGSPAKPPKYQYKIPLRNDDPINPKLFYIQYKPGPLPPNWKLTVNGGKARVNVPAGAKIDVPIILQPGKKLAAGKQVRVPIFASSMRTLVSDKNATDLHPDFDQLGGITVQALSVASVRLTCRATSVSGNTVFSGKLTVTKPGKVQPRLPVYVQGINSDGYRPGALLRVSSKGAFQGRVEGSYPQGICLFAGTLKLGSARYGPFVVSSHLANLYRGARNVSS